MTHSVARNWRVAAFLVLLERRAATLRLGVLIPFSLIVALVVGVNAASDPLLVIAGLVPFVLAITTSHLLARGPHSARAIVVAAGTLAGVALAWAGTAIAMSALH